MKGPFIYLHTSPYMHADMCMRECVQGAGGVTHAPVQHAPGGPPLGGGSVDGAGEGEVVEIRSALARSQCVYGHTNMCVHECMNA